MNNQKRAYENRKWIIATIVIGIALVYIGQLFNLQILNTQYRDFADSNAFYRKTLYPSRGAIYDRKNRLLVYNQPTYDVMMTVREMGQFDTLDFCRTLHIDKVAYYALESEMKDRKKNRGYSSYTPQKFMSQLSSREYGLLQEKLYKFPGISIQKRTKRQYKYPNMGLILGYTAEVDKNTMARDNYYVRGDFIGKSGIERAHEIGLRGEKGVEVLLRDARGRVQGKYKDGAFDKAPISGKDLTLGIDIELQAYGEYLMQNKIGSIIMIKPRTGEILCMIAAPSYDPSILTGRDFSNNYFNLAQNPYKPLLNRAVAGMYPPGSTFKPTQGMVALQEGVITTETRFSCHHGYPPLGGRPGCHGHASPLAIVPAIATSCNSFFCYCLNNTLNNSKKYKNINEAYDTWRKYMLEFGYGNKLNVDLPSEKSGFIPTSKFYNKAHKTEDWNPANIISIAIGQGEILATPLQIANFAAMIANRGYYYAPHVVKKRGEMALDTTFTRKHISSIHAKYFETMVEGMASAVTTGTCRRINLAPEVEVCGKTGTSENPHGKDHSLFMGFAPKNNPEVAIAVVVENGGYGATNAVPIARLMLQKFFKDSIPPQDKVLEDIMAKRVILPGIYIKNLQKLTSHE